MPSFLNACKRLLFNSLIMLAPMVVSGQGLVPAGGEYCIGGALFGDQVHPRLALNGNGGWLVWQDNSIDGQGFGIAAAQVGGAYGTVSNRFRVNETLGGNQEKPGITQLKDGTLMFAWQGNATVLPNVFARFMTPSRVFRSAEIQMTATFPITTNRWTTNIWSWYSNRYILRNLTLARVSQETRTGNMDPAVAALDDGTAVLVYSGIRAYYSSAQQLTTQMTIQQGLPYANDVLEWVTTSGDDMGEVFMQRFAANGAKLGDETLINQFSKYNQRNPAIASLPGGGFVTVWVSERYFPEVSPSGSLVDGKDRSDVQISGRLYSSAGVPVGGEFRINATNVAVCADPVVCASSDGNFLVTWSQFAGTNSWDIYGRMFGGDSRAHGGPFRVNTYTTGDQAASQVTALSNDFLVVWTSVGQDGSQEGVYGQVVSDGVLSGSEFRVNTTTRNKQMEPAIVPTGTNGFLAAWTQFSSMASGFNVMAQKFDLKAATKPNPPTVAAVSQSSLLVSWPAVPFAKSYALYMDNSATPINLANTSYEANGLNTGSTHTFRLSFGLTNGAVSRLSDSASGTTWTSQQAAQYASAGSSGSEDASEKSTGTGSSGSGTVVAIQLLITKTGTNYSLTWNSETGSQYQTQVSTNLQTWTNIGNPQSATGTATSQTYSEQTGNCFYRVIRVN
jgi:hypothetical protein